MKITEEMRRSMAATKADMDKAMEDPELRSEVDSLKAQYAVLELVESIMHSVASMRKINVFRKNFHRDFMVSVALGGGVPSPVFQSSREMAFA